MPLDLNLIGDVLGPREVRFACPVSPDHGVYIREPTYREYRENCILIRRTCICKIQDEDMDRLVYYAMTSFGLTDEGRENMEERQRDAYGGWGSGHGNS